MTFFYRMKLKYGRYAIHGLARYITALFAVGYLMLSLPPTANLYMRWLSFSPAAVLHGQIWRILTVLLYPPFANQGLVMALLGIYVYYNFASMVEQLMGEFEFNVYFFGSLLIGELGSLLYYLITGWSVPFLPVYMQFSVFMAFAIMYPDAQLLLMFALPIRAKVLAIAELLVYVYYFVFGDAYSMIFGMLYTRISVASAIIPIALFYFFVNRGNGGGNVISNFKWKLRQQKRRREWRNEWR